MGFLSIYLVAGDMGPEAYSLVGVYGVVFGIVLPFSHLGVETTMMREALYWIEQGDIEKVKEYTTQSIFSRFIGFTILFPIIIGYLLYMYFTKYECRYLLVLLSFYFGACGSALNDSMSLIVRSQGYYVFSQAAKTINNSAVKVIAVFVYLQFGLTPYLYIYCLLPWPLFLVFYLKNRKYIDFHYFLLSGTIKKIKESRNLWLKSYMDYFSKSADNLLVSVLFPPSIMGLYTMYRNLEGISINFMEGFFDVILQKFVRFKGNVEVLLKMEKKVNHIRWSVITLIVILTLLFAYDPSYFVELANLSKYEGIQYSIFVVSLISILYLIGKNEGFLITLMGPSKTILKLGVLLFFVSIASYIAVLFLQSIYGVYIQRLAFYTTTSIFSITIFYKNKLKYFKNIYK